VHPVLSDLRDHKVLLANLVLPDRLVRRAYKVQLGRKALAAILVDQEQLERQERQAALVQLVKQD
jgi:hypothetical protein